MSKVIGIDSGTGFSAMCVLEGGKAQVLTNKEGSRTTPSVVAWTKTGERLIGEAAKRQAVTNPKNTVYEFKRLMGRKYSEVKDELKYLSYDVVPGPNDECRVKVGDKLYSPEELTAMILRKLKEDAEAFLGEPVKEAIVTCPAYWNSDQRQCVKNAGTIAGLDVLRVINEPTAASLAYGLDKGGGKTIAVADSGAGTLDFTILEMNDGVFEVKSTSGDPRLGGKDYDDAIVEWLVSEFKAETGIDLSKDDMAKQRLKTEAEKAKIALSTSQSVEINLPFITADASGPKHLIKTLTLAKFEQLVSGLNDRYEAPAKKCLADSGKDKVDEVILVGGTTRIPSVQRKIKEIFGIEPSKSVNPDEAVAEGAAIQGGVIKGEVKDVLLLDVTPLTLGIETMGGVATPMIDRNTTIPTKKSNVFTTAADNQPCVTVRVCQGERPMFSDNKLLGSFNLDGIPPAPRGVPQVEVMFDIDANGILNVSAKDLGTGKEQKITITAASGLSKDDIERAKADAERNKEEDDRRAKLAAERNKADSLVFMTEKALKDAGDKAGEDEKKAVEEAVAKAREAVKGDDLAAIEAAVEGLNKANAAIAAKLYGSSGAPGGNFSAEDLEKMKNDPRFAELFKNGGPFGGQAAGGKNDDGAVDAEVVG